MNSVDCQLFLWGRGLVALIATALGIFVSYHAKQNISFTPPDNNSSSSKKSSAFLKKLFIFYIFSYFLALICAWIIPFKCMISVQFNDITWLTLKALYRCVLLPCVLLAFAARLYVIFDGSEYELSKKNRIILLSGLISNFLLFWIVTAMDIARVIKGMTEATLFWKVMSVLKVIGYSQYLALSIIVMGLFVSKIQALVISQQKSVPIPNIAYEISIQINELQRPLIKLMSKYLTLSCIAFGTTIAAIFVFILSLVYNENMILDVLFGCMFGIEVCVNLLSFYFTFAFAESQYRWTCSCLNKRFKEQVISTTKSKIKKSRASTMENISTTENTTMPMDSVTLQMTPSRIPSSDKSHTSNENIPPSSTVTPVQFIDDNSEQI